MKMYPTIRKLTAVALMSAFLPIVTVSPIFLPGKAIAAVPANNSPTMLVQGKSNKGNFVGSLTVTSFQAVNGVLSAVGTLSGTVTNAAGVVTQTVTNQAVTVPVASINGSCTILDLTLGAVHLNLLGLVVDLNQVHLTITAQPAGGLLGQLLCDLANLLNGGSLSSLLSQIVTQLNQILAAL
jgi:hypothetical protein